MNNHPTILTEFLDGEVAVTALGLNDAVLVIDKDEPLIVNRIPIEMRLYMKRRENGSWYSVNTFIYRLDNEVFHPQHHATEGQQRKIYRAAVELCEELNETFLREGEVARMDHEIDVFDDRIRQYQEERAGAVKVRDRFAAFAG